MKHIRVAILLAACTYGVLVAQTDTTRVENLNTDEARNFSLVFTRGLIITDARQDTVPLNGTGSGTYVVGAGFKFPLVKNTLGLRVAPSLAITQYTYEQTAAKTYPTIADSLPYTLALERQGAVFGELPVGVYLNFNKDEDGDPRFFLEAGGYVGLLVAANYKTRYTNAEGLREKNKVRDLQKIESEWQRLRYGLYARVGYKWASLYVSYRLSEVFDEFTNEAYRPRPGEGFRNPQLPPIEVGISLFL
ncbi:MAG: hypothetical protein OHK0039_24700 [Bacteroidia bacterium]